MNRRRPWPQRLVRKVTRHDLLKVVMPPSPLSILFGFNVLGSIIALLSGFPAVASVLGIAAFGCLACQLRKQTILSTRKT
jgi:hypothetical protein